MMSLFHHRGQEYKSRKSRDSWSNSQVWPSSTKWSRAKPNRVLSRECTVTAITLFWQHNRWPYTWTSPDGHHQNQIDYILCNRWWRSSTQSAKTRLGADCDSDHELLIAKFRPTLKKVGKTTRPFRYNLSQIPYDYILEMRNRFKGLDLIDTVPDKLWMEVCDIVQKAVIRPSPRKTNAKRQNGCLKRPYT